MTASVPSKIALATSVTSARVGKGDFCHVFEHLCCCNDQSPFSIGCFNNAFLYQRNLSNGGFNTEITTCHHDPLRKIYDLFDIINCLWLFDFRNDGHVWISIFCEIGTNHLQIFGMSNKRRVQHNQHPL